MEFAFELDACVCAYEDAAGVKVSKISLRSTLWPIYFDDDCDVDFDHDFDDDCDVDFDHDLMMIVMLILMMIIVMMTIRMMRLMMMLMEMLMI